VDFSEKIIDLLNSGYSQVEIGDQAGVTSQFIGHLKTGISKEPRYSIGVRILNLHKALRRRRRKS